MGRGADTGDDEERVPPGSGLAVRTAGCGHDRARGRAIAAAARRFVVKVGSSSLTTAGGGIDDDRIAALADVLARRAAAGAELVLVSSGAIASGLAPLGLGRRPRDLATQQAAASVGQVLLAARYTAAFAKHGVRAGQVLLTADDLMRRSHYRNAQRTLGRLLEFGVLPVVNENDTVATEEIRFGDNDRLAALVAHVVRADALVLLSDVDALYDGEPHRAGSRRITEVRGRHDLEGIRLGRAGGRGVGTGGMVTKVESALIATGAGIPVVLAAASEADAALAGDPVGTYFAARWAAPGHAAALAGARHHRPRPADARPGCGGGHRGPPDVPASRRSDRGRGAVRRW